jgi:hypothetical protein
MHSASNIPLLRIYNGGRVSVQMSLMFVAAGKWDAAIICQYLKQNGTLFDVTLARFRVHSVDETDVQQIYDAPNCTVYQAAYGSRRFYVTLGRFLITEIRTLQCSWPIETMNTVATEGFYAVLNLKLVVPFALPIVQNAVVCFSTIYSFVIAAEVNDLPSFPGEIKASPSDVFDRVCYSDQVTNVTLVLSNQIEVLDMSCFTILVTNTFNRMIYSVDASDLSTGTMETVVTFLLPQVQHDGSFAALSILCYENVVFKNEGYPEISQFWYSQGNLVDWKQHPSIASVFPAKCMAFAFCLVDVVIENFNFQNERSLVIVNSSAHQASFTLVPVVAGRRGLISFSPVPIFFSKNGILPMVVIFSDSSQRQLPMSFVSSVPSPYILSAMPSRIPCHLDVLVRVVVVNLSEIVENKQVFAFFVIF